MTKIQNIQFVRNFIQSAICEFHYDDVTVASLWWCYCDVIYKH